MENTETRLTREIGEVREQLRREEARADKYKAECDRLTRGFHAFMRRVNADALANDLMRAPPE